MRSTGINGVMFVATLAFLHDLVRGDTEVTCVVMESCVLPCEFHAGNDIVIHWIHMTTGNTVHSYYYDEDQFKNQDQRFRNRTFLFKEQISRGNASLRLTQVETADQGKYKCHTSIPEREATSFVNLKVEDAAPVTPTSVLLSSTQLNFPTQRSVDENQDGSDNGDNSKKIIIGVVSVILVLGIIGGLTGFCLYRHEICCSSENLQNPPADRELDRLDGGEQRARPNGETDPLNNQD